MIDLSETIHNGIIKAQSDYIEWSDLGLGHSAEYLIVANIAQKMGDLKMKDKLSYIYVEQSITELADWDNLSEDIKYRKGRCDICLENEDGYAIIEVKNTLTNIGGKLESIIEDIKRIKIFLENKNDIKESYICFINANYIEDKPNTDDNRNNIYKKIDTRLTNVEEKIKNKFENLKFIISEKKFIEITSEDKIWAWQSVVIKIELSK